MRLRFLTALPLLATSSPAEVEREIPWGAEVVTGWRTEYLQRGFKLANDLLSDADISQKLDAGMVRALLDD